MGGHAPSTLTFPWLTLKESCLLCTFLQQPAVRQGEARRVLFPWEWLWVPVFSMLDIRPHFRVTAGRPQAPPRKACVPLALTAERTWTPAGGQRREEVRACLYTGLAWSGHSGRRLGGGGGLQEGGQARGEGRTSIRNTRGRWQ